MEEENIKKEIKEITRSNERWCKIVKPTCSVIISSPYKEDSMKSITEEADRLAEKHSTDNNPNYVG